MEAAAEEEELMVAAAEEEEMAQTRSKKRELAGLYGGSPAKPAAKGSKADGGKESMQGVEGVRTCGVNLWWRMGWGGRRREWCYAGGGKEAMSVQQQECWAEWKGGAESLGHICSNDVSLYVTAPSPSKIIEHQ